MRAKYRTRLLQKDVLDLWVLWQGSSHIRGLVTDVCLHFETPGPSPTWSATLVIRALLTEPGGDFEVAWRSRMEHAFGPSENWPVKVWEDTPEVKQLVEDLEYIPMSNERMDPFDVIERAWMLGTSTKDGEQLDLDEPGELDLVGVLAQELTSAFTTETVSDHGFTHMSYHLPDLLKDFSMILRPTARPGPERQAVDRVHHERRYVL